MNILQIFTFIIIFSGQPIDTEKMKIKELRKERFRLLDDIHEKQQQLDQIDYQIYQKKNEEGKEGS